MFKSQIESDLKKVVKELGFLATDVVCSSPQNSKFGDYTSNVALQLANQKHKKKYQNPREIASEILEHFGHPSYLERIEIAGPGFLNFFLKDEYLVKLLLEEYERHEETGQRYLFEFAHPNTHKSFHIGHLRNVTTGEALARLTDYQGNDVFRVTYGGDIGPHVAKAIWGILDLKDEYEAVKNKTLRERAEFLGKAYAHGSLKYEENESTKSEIDSINKRLYENDQSLKGLSEETKNWSIGYFETIYSRVGTVFDIEIWESEVQEQGSLLVQENLGKIFVLDDGAVIFPGEKYGLHNRVFITKAGYPTYEGKELGVTRRESEIFPYDKSIHVVANEQESFFQVTTKAIELVEPQLKGKKQHLSYGMVNLSTGKMSSRKGGVITAESLIDDVKVAIKSTFQANKSVNDLDLDKIAIGAIKFFFLKYSLSSNIAFDIEKSISLHGDTGPYVLYTFARINSLLNRANNPLASNHDSTEAKSDKPKPQIAQRGLEKEEREVLRMIEYFELRVEDAAKKFSPNELAEYLLELAKSFNLFYEKFPIIGSEREYFRLELSKKVGETIKLGMHLLGIETVDRM